MTGEKFVGPDKPTLSSAFSYLHTKMKPICSNTNSTLTTVAHTHTKGLRIENALNACDARRCRLAVQGKAMAGDTVHYTTEAEAASKCYNLPTNENGNARCKLLGRVVALEDLGN
jgi:hypothetical protein